MYYNVLYLRKNKKKLGNSISDSSASIESRGEFGHLEIDYILGNIKLC